MPIISIIILIPLVYMILEMIQVLANALCDNPVVVTLREGENTDCYILTPQKIDAGQLLGRRGRNLNALRQIVYAMASKERRKRVTVQLADHV
jgi:predicted RNA-binding protein YlqC (UPF0109 family)